MTTIPTPAERAATEAIRRYRAALEINQQNKEKVA